MSEKKVCKIDDEAMKNVVGGQGANPPSEEGGMSCNPNINIDVNLEDLNAVRPLCPECGGELGGTIAKGNNSSMTMFCVCPHCKKAVCVTV